MFTSLLHSHKVVFNKQGIVFPYIKKQKGGKHGIYHCMVVGSTSISLSIIFYRKTFDEIGKEELVCQKGNISEE